AVGDAVDLADQVVEVRLDVERNGAGRPAVGGSLGSRQGIRPKGRPHRVDHLIFIAEGDQTAGQVEALRRGPEDLRRAQGLGRLEGGRRWKSRVAAVLPVGVPARGQPEMEAQDQLAVPRCHLPRADQPHARLWIDRPLARRPTRGARREEDRRGGGEGEERDLRRVHGCLVRSLTHGGGGRIPGGLVLRGIYALADPATFANRSVVRAVWPLTPPSPSLPPQSLPPGERGLEKTKANFFFCSLPPLPGEGSAVGERGKG